MRVLASIIIFCLLHISCYSKESSSLRLLDEAISNVDEIDDAYVSQVENLKKSLARDGITDDQAYMLNKKILERYQFFKADSALKYAQATLDIANRLGNDDLVWEVTLLKLDVLARSGLFHQAMSILEQMPTDVPKHLKTNYFYTRYNICQYAYEYTYGTEYQQMYFDQKLAFGDSVLNYADENSFIYHSVKPAMYLDADSDYAKSIEYTIGILPLYKSGTREYSVLTSQVGYAYAMIGMDDEEIDFLAKSAESDIRASVKENMASRLLADKLLSSGDIVRANRCLNKSIEDANFYSARMRHIQSAAVLPFVYNAYNQMNHSRQTMLIWIAILLSLIAILIISSYFIIRKKNVALAINNSQLITAQDELLKINDKYQQTNASLEETNNILAQSKTQLEEANKIKNAYLSQFFWLCSSIINRTSSFRNKLVLLAKTNKKEALFEALDSTKEENEISSDFYRAFDEAFLSIKPDFIDQVNQLLSSPLLQKVDDTSCQLSTEQRILALMNLGVTDNKKIANFLRCSVSTVYTYRSKMKTKAINSREFEQNIMKI